MRTENLVGSHQELLLCTKFKEFVLYPEDYEELPLGGFSVLSSSYEDTNHWI